VKLGYLIRGLPGHPLHPPLTDATIGIYTFATIAAVADVLGISNNAATHGWWLALLAGLITTVATAVTGLLDWLTIERGTELWKTATFHALAMVTATVFFGLAALTALMLWVLDRSSPRSARGQERTPEPWDGVRQAAVSVSGAGEQRGAVCEAARGIARADSAQLWEVDEAGDLVALEMSGIPPRERRLRLPDAVRAELREDWPPAASGLLDAIEAPILGATGTLRVHLEPMCVRNRVAGFLAVGWNAYVSGPGDEARSVLALLAAHAALVVERTELERSARTDALTALPNRRAFEDELAREMARATRVQAPLTVALLVVFLVHTSIWVALVVLATVPLCLVLRPAVAAPASA